MFVVDPPKIPADREDGKHKDQIDLAVFEKLHWALVQTEEAPRV